jgi:hypothetical protein
MEKWAYSGEYAVLKVHTEVQYEYFSPFLNVVIISNKTILHNLYYYEMTKLPSIIMDHYCI